jgi:hypothetical protein
LESHIVLDFIKAGTFVTSWITTSLRRKPRDLALFNYVNEKFAENRKKHSAEQRKKKSVNS